MPRSRSTASKASPRRRADATPRAVRLLDAVGSSRRSWADAVTAAVRDAKDDAPKAVVVEVSRLWADLDARGAIRRYRAAVRIAYPQRIVPLRRASAKR